MANVKIVPKLLLMKIERGEHHCLYMVVTAGSLRAPGSESRCEHPIPTLLLANDGWPCAFFVTSDFPEDKAIYDISDIGAELQTWLDGRCPKGTYTCDSCAARDSTNSSSDSSMDGDIWEVSLSGHRRVTVSRGSSRG